MFVFKVRGKSELVWGIKGLSVGRLGGNRNRKTEN
jgi:hypothetical protein